MQHALVTTHALITKMSASHYGCIHLLLPNSTPPSSSSADSSPMYLIFRSMFTSTLQPKLCEYGSSVKEASNQDHRIIHGNRRHFDYMLFPPQQTPFVVFTLIPFFSVTLRKIRMSYIQFSQKQGLTDHLFWLLSVVNYSLFKLLNASCNAMF